MFWSTTLALLVLVFQNVSGEECSTLDGTWYNTLGSEMIITHGEDGHIVGEYRTAVERQAGSAGGTHSTITGVAARDVKGSVIGMTVSWRGGKSTTGWTGQCHVCDGKEVLMTSWLLRSQVDTCIDKWKSTLIGQDFFYREEQREGPRKDDDTHTPQDVTQSPGDKQTTRLRRKRSENDTKQPCSLNGDWFNELGSKVNLIHAEDGFISGSYETAAQRGLTSHDTGSDFDQKLARVFGIGSLEENNRTMSFFKIWNGGNSVTGWVGQCHTCIEDGEEVDILETTWLHRTRVPGCDANWRSTLYGQTGFKRDDNRRVSEDPSITGEFGDDVATLLCASEANTLVTGSFFSVIFVVISIIKSF